MNSDKVKIIIDELDRHYDRHIKCYLDHENAWQLLIATILSAQCTDERVNLVTKTLFRKYKNLSDLANADLKILEDDIHSVGFYHNKAKNIIACADMLLKYYGGDVPSDIDLLVQLPGVGRKTANVIRGNIFDIPSIVVDTHVARVSRRLGLTLNEDPLKVEKDLEVILPKKDWIAWNILVIAHGRSLCSARSPKCNDCFLRAYCDFCS